MTSLLIGAGEGLGLFEQAGGGLIYGVRFGQRTFQLEKDAYKVWQVAKMGYAEEKFAEFLDIPKKNLELYINQLENFQLLIRWNEAVANEIFQSYALVPKGQIVKKEEEDFVFEEIPKSEPKTFPLFPTTIWRLANPYYNLDTLLNQLVEITGFTNNEVRDLMMNWIPYLVSQGLVSLDQVR